MHHTKEEIKVRLRHTTQQTCTVAVITIILPLSLRELWLISFMLQYCCLIKASSSFLIVCRVAVKNIKDNSCCTFCIPVTQKHIFLLQFSSPESKVNVHLQTKTGDEVGLSLLLGPSLVICIKQELQHTVLPECTPDDSTSAHPTHCLLPWIFLLLLVINQTTSL